MNLAVKFYKQNPDIPPGMPPEWPWQCIELGDTTTPPDDGWIVMSEVEYNNYRATLQMDYDEYTQGLGGTTDANLGIWSRITSWLTGK
jgi:hypothetical protein